MNRISTHFNKRVPLKKEKLSGIIEALNEQLPAHMKNWYYALGATPLILFLFMIVTGILLTFYYIPSPGKASEVLGILSEVLVWGSGLGDFTGGVLILWLMQFFLIRP